MKSKQTYLNEFREFIDWVIKLDYYNETVWRGPIAEGKWCMQEIISHMMLWDKLFLEEAIQKIANHEPLTYKNRSFASFNASARVFGMTQTKAEVIEQAIAYRSKLIACLEQIPEADYDKAFTDGEDKPFQIAEYIEDFVGHDRHHASQIHQYLESLLL
jgi:hypothetical protein